MATTNTKRPPSVEILYLRHSKAHYLTLPSGSVSSEKARVNFLAAEAKRWARK